MTAIKCLLLLILLLAVAAGAGIAGCRIAGSAVHFREMLLACAIAFAAAGLAVVPALASQGKFQTAGMFQAAFVGTVIHLGLILVVALVMLVLKRMSPPLVFWLLGAYWATLIGIIVTFAKLIHAAPKPAAKGT